MQLLTVNDAASRLALKPATIRKMITRHELPCVRPTRRAVRLRLEDVEALIRIGYRSTPPPSTGAGAA